MDAKETVVLLLEMFVLCMNKVEHRTKKEVEMTIVHPCFFSFSFSNPRDQGSLCFTKPMKERTDVEGRWFPLR